MANKIHDATMQLDKYLETPDGIAAIKPNLVFPRDGQYLENRIRNAFYKGYSAGETKHEREGKGRPGRKANIQNS